MAESLCAAQYLNQMPENSPSDLQAIGARLIELRSALGHTQAEMARLIGTTSQALFNWEQGVNRPSIDMAFKISAGTGGVPIGYIYIGDTRGMPFEVMEKLQAFRKSERPSSSRLA